jgi:hypothetical protein
MMRRLSVAVLALAPLLLAPARATAQAQPASPTTQVMVALTVRPAVARGDLMKTMPDEIRATVKLYLDGKIQQWYSRSDGKGVVFILNASSVGDAKALMDALPLAKADFATFEFTALTPLTPLRILLAEPAPSARENPRP